MCNKETLREGELNEIEMMQITEYEYPDTIILVGCGIPTKYEDWLYDERKRFRKHGRKAEVRRHDKRKALFVDKVA
jgi:hypothetical protein